MGEPDPRPLALLHHAGRTFRDLWRRYAQALATARAKGASWPPHCFAPSGLGSLVLDSDRSPIPNPGPIVDALAAWRPTQGIYRLHPALLDALWTTSLSGELPAELLRRLPEWCVYVETPGRNVGDGKPIHGFYAHLVHRPDLDADELRLVLDFDAPIEFMLDVEPVPLIGTLEESLRHAATEQLDFAPDWFVDRLVETATPLGALVNVLLYLCSEAPELKDASRRRDRPRRPRLAAPRRKGKLGKLPAAAVPTIWEAGFDLGAQLEQAVEQAHETDSEGRTVRPHVRRAHWHSYWRGPRDGERERVVRWISPLLIGAREAGGFSTT